MWIYDDLCQKRGRIAVQVKEDLMKFLAYEGGGANSRLQSVS